MQELLGAVDKIQGLLDQVSNEKDEMQTSVYEESIRYVLHMLAGRGVKEQWHTPIMVCIE